MKIKYVGQGLFNSCVNSISMFVILIVEEFGEFRKKRTRHEMMVIEAAIEK